MAQRVADGITAKILDGTYKLGERLREASLTQQLGLSSSVVREAFHILQGQGVVVTDPYRGRRVFSFENIDEYKDLVITRTSLESLAAFLAARRLDADGAENISQEAEQFRKATPTSYVEIIRLELAFHKAIWTAAKSPSVFRELNHFFFPVLSIQTMQYLAPGLSVEEMLKRNAEFEATDHEQGHQRLARAILARDAAAARTNMVSHLASEDWAKEMRKEVFGL